LVDLSVLRLSRLYSVMLSSITLLESTIVLMGFLTATLSGVAGMGGGSILIGVLLVLGMPPLEAVPLFAAVQLVSNVSRTTAYWPHVDGRATGWFLLAAVPTTLLTVGMAARVDPEWAQLALAALILFSLAPAPSAWLQQMPRRHMLVVAGALNGVLGNVVGATGLFVGRLFLRPDWSRRTTVGTLALTQTLGHGLRVIAFGFAGLSVLARPALLIGLALAVMLGTALGRRLNDRLDEARFAQLVRGILFALSGVLIIPALWTLWTSN
jgi:uncharacterized protein